MLDQRGQQRKLIGKVLQDPFEVAFQGAQHATACLLGGLPRIAPGGELPRDGFLNGLAVGQVDGPSRPNANEVTLVQGEARREPGRLDKTADPIGCRGRHAEPVPASLDDLAECAD